MRYRNVDTISFTDVYGNSYAVKDMREIPDYETLKTLKLKQGDRIDEIVSRPEFYGNGTEDESYKVFEHNIDIITEADFDLSKIKELEIPIR